MEGLKRTVIADERGLTLAELLASIVIVSIILISVITIFVQTVKTNQTSEEIIDATYVAQTEIENVYEQSFDGPKSLIGFTEASKDGDWTLYEKTEEGYFILLRTQPHEDTGLMRIVVQVFDNKNDTKPKAQMEHLLEWGAKDEETP